MQLLLLRTLRLLLLALFVAFAGLRFGQLMLGWMLALRPSWRPFGHSVRDTALMLLRGAMVGVRLRVLLLDRACVVVTRRDQVLLFVSLAAGRG